MADGIEVYQIMLEASGRMTQIPDSQKLFGALIYLYADATSSAEASRFVADVKSGACRVALSNALPLDYLPVPHALLLDRLDDDDKEFKRHYKEIKKRHYVPEEELAELMENPEEAQTVYPYISVRDSQQMHSAMDSLRLGIPGLDPSLYSVPESTALLYREESDGGEEIRQFQVYLSVSAGSAAERLLFALEKSRDGRKPFFMGTRASQGLNILHIQAIAKAPDKTRRKTKRYLNTGMLLPQDISYRDSALQLFTSERRPYEQAGGWAEDAERTFISYIEAGSIIYPLYGSEKAGRCIDSPFDQRAIVFGNAFLYPLDERSGNA